VRRQTVTAWALALCAGLVGGWCAGCGQHVSATPANATPQRIISLAPSITETLFALGCGSRVVGVSSFCTHPPEATRLPTVGAYLDPNFEAMLRLKPDLVVLMREASKVAQMLQANGIRTLGIDNHDVSAILESFRSIGDACGRQAAADSLVGATARALSDTVRGGARPRIMICVGRGDIGSGSVSQAFFAGPRTFYEGLMRAAGGANAITDSLVAYPALSGEGIIRSSPDIIIDLVADTGGVTHERIVADWGQYTLVPAVRSASVYCLTGEYVTIPGPRIGLILDDFKRIVAQYRATAPRLARQAGGE
jgi:iron complex transport system substrate-binding protein